MGWVRAAPRNAPWARSGAESQCAGVETSLSPSRSHPWPCASLLLGFLKINPWFWLIKCKGSLTAHQSISDGFIEAAAPGAWAVN